MLGTSPYWDLDNPVCLWRIFQLPEEVLQLNKKRIRTVVGLLAGHCLNKHLHLLVELTVRTMRTHHVLDECSALEKERLGYLGDQFLEPKTAQKFPHQRCVQVYLRDNAGQTWRHNNPFGPHPWAIIIIIIIVPINFLFIYLNKCSNSAQICNLIIGDSGWKSMKNLSCDIAFEERI